MVWAMKHHCFSIISADLVLLCPPCSAVLCCAVYRAGKGRGKRILLPFQLAVLIGISITYCVVGGQSLHAFAEGLTPSGGHTPGMWVFIIIFGGLQLFLSMVGLWSKC